MAFGANAQGYDSSRPPYPGWMFALLAEANVLRAKMATLEVGPGNGLATRKLLAAGVSPLTLVEPDQRFAPLLEALVDEFDAAADFRYEPFEEAGLPDAAFDLVLVATAFHWLDPASRVERLARVTRPGGAVVLLWNVFGDANLPDPFHEATKSVLAHLAASPSGAPDALPFGLDRGARENEFLADGTFEVSLYAESHWPLTLDARRVRALYEGFSGIARLPEAERSALLDKVEHIASTEFGGVVVRNMTSALYVFKRT